MKQDKIVGQIVEIPSDFIGYQNLPPVFNNKKEELDWSVKYPLYSLFDGILIGGHTGIENYKIGQRKGLHISGFEKPFYIIAFDRTENRIFVGAGHNHPGLYRKVISVPKEKIEFKEDLFEFNIEEKLEITVKNNKNLQEEVNLYQFDNEYLIEFKKPVKVFDINQELYFYKNEEYLGKTNSFYQL